MASDFPPKDKKQREKKEESKEAYKKEHSSMKSIQQQIRMTVGSKPHQEISAHSRQGQGEQERKHIHEKHSCVADSFQAQNSVVLLLGVVDEPGKQSDKQKQQEKGNRFHDGIADHPRKSGLFLYGLVILAERGRMIS